MSSRGIANVGCLALLLVGMVALFAGYPVVMYVNKSAEQKAAFALGGA